MQHNNLKSRITATIQERINDRICSACKFNNKKDEDRIALKHSERIIDRIFLACNSKCWWAKSPQLFSERKMDRLLSTCNTKSDETKRPNTLREKHWLSFLAFSANTWWVKSPQHAQREKLTEFSLFLSQKFDDSSHPQTFQREKWTEFSRHATRNLMNPIALTLWERNIDRNFLAFNTNIWWVESPEKFKEKNWQNFPLKSPQNVQREKLTELSLPLIQKFDESNRPKMFREKNWQNFPCF